MEYLAFERSNDSIVGVVRTTKHGIGICYWRWRSWRTASFHVFFAEKTYILHGRERERTNLRCFCHFSEDVFNLERFQMKTGEQ